MTLLGERRYGVLWSLPSPGLPVYAPIGGTVIATGILVSCATDGTVMEIRHASGYEAMIQWIGTDEWDPPEGVHEVRRGDLIGRSADAGFVKFLDKNVAIELRGPESADGLLGEYLPVLLNPDPAQGEEDYWYRTRCCTP